MEDIINIAPIYTRNPSSSPKKNEARNITIGINEACTMPMTLPPSLDKLLKNKVSPILIPTIVLSDNSTKSCQVRLWGIKLVNIGMVIKNRMVPTTDLNRFSVLDFT